MTTTATTLILLLLVRLQTGGAWVQQQRQRRPPRRVPTFVEMVSREEYLRPRFVETTATAAVPEDADHKAKMLECARTGACGVDEMSDMIRELESFSGRGSGSLKQALALQIELASLKDGLDCSDSNDNNAIFSHSAQDYEDHSFDHFVDYRGIGDYESH